MTSTDSAKVPLLDGDILAYEIGFAVQSDGDIPDWGLVQVTLEHRLEEIQQGLLSNVNASWPPMVFLSHRDHKTPRFDNATLQTYKGHRTQEKPYHWQGIRDYLVSEMNAVLVAGAEADDAISVLLHKAPEQYICVSRDKDLRQAPGYHYSWKCGQTPDNFTTVDYLQGKRFLFQQMLTGDRTDNILGVPGIGEKSAAVKRLSTLHTEEQFAAHVYEQYVKVFRNMAFHIFMEHGDLLMMWRQKEDTFAKYLLSIGVTPEVTGAIQVKKGVLRSADDEELDLSEALERGVPGDAQPSPRPDDSRELHGEVVFEGQQVGTGDAPQIHWS